VQLTLITDVASAELFADRGLTPMSAIFFANEPFTQLRIRSVAGKPFQHVALFAIKN
jgi:fructan beta-fructosidase